jgi:hypothetical protein
VLLPDWKRGVSLPDWMRRVSYSLFRRQWCYNCVPAAQRGEPGREV